MTHENLIAGGRVSNICLVCGNTHPESTNCKANEKSKAIPDDARNVRCVVCDDWFHRDGIHSHLRSCAKKQRTELTRLRKAIEDALKHQEIVGGSMAKMSTTCRILRNALEGKE